MHRSCHMEYSIADQIVDRRAMNEYDVLVVGAGLSGAVIAERCARVLNQRVLVVDKRDHIAGNCYDYVNEYGHLVNKYGLHIFHTNDTDIYNYIRQFAEWVRYDHKVVARVHTQLHETRLVPIPVGIETVNLLCNLHLSNSQEMEEWLAQHQVRYDHTIQNGEEAAKARVGEHLYQLLFEQYTFKQWNKTPAQLDPSILNRIPLRKDFDNRYFTDRYQLLPKLGYTHFVQQLLKHPLITTQLSTDFFHMQQQNYNTLVYTGPIDRYFYDAGLPKLEYRSIRFEQEHVPLQSCSGTGFGFGFAQSHLVINEPSLQVPYTRSVEYKHLPMNAHIHSSHSVIVREYSTEEGEPYYPVINPRNLALYQEYQKLAQVLETKQGVIMLGRLANYKYLDMHAAIANALEVFETRIKTRHLDSP